mgnify:CR=1 FL=1|jgi:hypothetical protein
MALLPKLKVDSQTIDNDKITLVDDTGLYDLITNPGGYGTPNPDRADLGLFVYGYEYNPDGDDVLLSTDNTEPDTLSSWEFSISGDGYMYFLILVFNAWDFGTIYSQEDLVYHNSNFYKALQVSIGTEPSPVSTISWDILSDAEIIAEKANLINGRLDELNMQDGDICFSNIVADAASKSVYDNCTDYLPVFQASVLYNGSFVLCNRDLYSRGHITIKSLNEKCNGTSKPCGCY